MSTQFYRDSYDNISQRVVASLIKGIAPLEPAATNQPGTMDGQMDSSQRDMHEFFTALYAAMYDQPARFGMPTSPDDFLSSDREGKERKQEVTKKVKRPQQLVDLALEFLQELGCKGEVSGDGLVLDEQAYRALFETKSKSKKAIVAGMSEIGLVVEAENGRVKIRNTRYPQMMPALKAMAESCAADGEQKRIRSAFARCDFRALNPGYQIDALSLLGYFAPDDRARAIELHNYMLDTGHQAICRAYNAHGWDIQYQGPRKIKGTPLVQIDYSERHSNPMRVQIKCASADRLIPTFAEQPPAVQADFRTRVGRCGGTSCGWCKDKKGLNPSVLEYAGERLTICWFTQAHLSELNDETMEVLRGYVRWHQQLA